ncbi:MAG: aminoacetone oxidase family FAD-binding enzyme [Lachnospiraceae bacterium]|nr:aminoacetone oxidase family FAD-binding enzyme [Lachnospiraceae bacterium]
MKKQNVAIIGGGAAGLVAAIAAAKEGARVTVFERNDRVGKKILMTGNGKCNLTNLSYDASCYFSSNTDILKKLLSLYDQEDVMQLFRSLGLFLQAKEGRVYPLSEQASSVLDALRFGCVHLGVILKTDVCIDDIRCLSQNKEVPVYQVAGECFDAVILSTGGKSYPKTGSDGKGFDLAGKLGLHVCSTVPALVPLICQENFFKSVSGVRVKATLTLFIAGENRYCETGELQLTDYGISGIPVFQFSRLAAYGLQQKKKVSVTIDFLPDLTIEEIMASLHTRFLLWESRTAEEFFNGLLHKKLLMLFFKLQAISPETKMKNVTEEKIKIIISQMKKFSVTVKDTRGFEQAQVTAGGVSLDEVSERMEARRLPGLYLAGELLDVDGICGGYNLQWAFASGAIAGKWAGKKENN